MKSTYRPHGVFSAQWLPIDGTGSLDRAALAAHIDFERSHGVRGVLALGSTGEFPFFNIDERKAAISAVAELSAGMSVIVNISDIRPQAAIDLGRFAASVGADAVAIMPPMFFPVAPADILEYFLRVAEQVGLPVMLYNFPELTGKRLTLETVAAFADQALMVAIKQSGAEFDYHRELIALGKEKDFVVMSGADTRLVEAFGLGAAGCIGGLVNIVPELMVQIYDACRNGRPEDAAESARRMVELGQVIDQLTFPPNVAAGLAARGFAPGKSKSILSPRSQELSQRITADLRELFRRWELGTSLVEA